MTSIKLQNIVFQYDADANFRTYTQLMHKGDDLAYDPEAKCHILKKYDRVNFTSYFNCLQIRRWKEQTYAKRFTLRLELQGKAFVELETVYRNSKSINYGVLSQQVVSSEGRSFVDIEIPETDNLLVGFSITALEDTFLYSGCYMTEVEQSEIRDIYISLASTTFRKEAYIIKNIRTLREKVLCPGSDLEGHLFVNVVDNGRTLCREELESENIRIHPNMNVGGAGGFTRGMIESLNLPKKPTHVLLMDDDVLLMGESLFRTDYLLRILKPEYQEYFVSGAMFDYDQRQIQYEDIGYVHPEDGSYGPLKDRMDMTLVQNLLNNELMSKREKPESYAGWWYCCIPTPVIERNGLPLPVFVRGDDVEFSIRNNAKFLTLNGISIWHVGFAGKFNAAMELYQVHRNSLVIQAASGICKNVDFIKRMEELFRKEITRFSYNNAEQILDAIEDFLKGPEFLQNLNGEASIREHGAKNDKMVPIEEFPAAYNLKNGDPYSYTRLNLIQKGWYVITINGHLLPNFLLRRWHEVIAYDWFFVPGKNFMRRNLVAMNPNDNTACMRTINRKRCFSLLRRHSKLMRRYKAEHAAVEKAYRDAFAHMTSVEFWKEYLKL